MSQLKQGVLLYKKPLMQVTGKLLFRITWGKFSAFLYKSSPIRKLWSMLLVIIILDFAALSKIFQVASSEEHPVQL